MYKYNLTEKQYWVTNSSEWNIKERQDREEFFFFFVLISCSRIYGIFTECLKPGDGHADDGPVRDYLFEVATPA